MKIVRLNPFPPYPPLPSSIVEGEWIKALLHYRTFVAWRMSELRSDLASAKVPPSKIPSTSQLAGQDGGLVDALAAAMAQTRVPGDKLWAVVPPDVYVANALTSAFEGVRGNKRAEKRLATEVTLLANRIREDLLAMGRIPVDARAVSARPASERPPSARPVSERPPSARPASEKPAKKPRTRKKPVKVEEPPPSARPPSARPPSASSRPPSAEPPSAKPPSAKPPSAKPPSARRPPSASTRMPSAEELDEEMREHMEEAAEALHDADVPPSGGVSGARTRIEEELYEDVPEYDEGAFRKGRPIPPRTSPGSYIPRLRELSEATLRSEREWFYEDKKASRFNRPCPMTRRLEGFWPYRAGMRPPIRPSKSVLETYEDDVLLLVIPPQNVVQVFTKGALTEVFASSREEHALSIAARYANQWRGVKPDGTIMRDAKRSRLNSGIYAAYYTTVDRAVEDNTSEVVLLGEPIVEVLERDLGARGRKLANPARGRSTPLRLTMRDEVDAPYVPTIIRIRNPR